jgi:hypothetical protein
MENPVSTTFLPGIFELKNAMNQPIKYAIARESKGNKNNTVSEQMKGAIANPITVKYRTTAGTNTKASKKKEKIYRPIDRENKITHEGIGMDKSKSLSFASYNFPFATKIQSTILSPVATTPTNAKYVHATPAPVSGAQSEPANSQNKNPIAPSA